MTASSTPMAATTGRCIVSDGPVARSESAGQDARASGPAPWLTVGAEVVELTQHHHGGTGNIKRSTVQKIGKRDVVLANGSRFNVERLRKSQNSSWDPSTELLSPDDPRVQRVSDANRRSHLFGRADDAWTEFRRARTAETGRAVIGAIQAFVEAIDAAKEVRA